jgi:NADH-quinone oxidoreductase subunit J
MVVFVILAVLAIAGALGTITFKSGIYSALSLVGTLLTLAMMYVTLHAQFLASVQVMVYAGAIMVLFLFVIMLLNESQMSGADPLPWVQPVAIAGGIVMAVALAFTAFQFKAPKNLETATAALQGGTPGAIGETLFTKFLLPFEAVSILLLIAAIGAVSLVHRQPAHNESLETTSELATDGAYADEISSSNPAKVVA